MLLLFRKINKFVSKSTKNSLQRSANNLKENKNLWITCFLKETKLKELKLSKISNEKKCFYLLPNKIL